jgi:NADH-quinone oxidoreductase subunit M
MADATLLNVVLFLPVAGILLLLVVPARSEGAIRWVTFWVMMVQLAACAVLYAHYDATVAGLQFETRIPWIPDWGVHYQIGLDGYNILLVLLTAFLGPLVVAGAFSAIGRT